MARVGTPEWRRNISRGRRSGTSGPPATAHPTLRDIVWAAGFYEGEGSCGAYPTSERCVTPLLTMKMVQVNDEPLRRMQRLFGGNASRWVRRKDKRGYWQLQLNGARAIGFILTIYPLLSRQRQAQIRLALQKVRHNVLP